MPHRRWTPEEKIRIVLESLNTSIGVAELCRKYAVNPVVFYAWKEKFKKSVLDNRGPLQRFFAPSLITWFQDSAC